MAAGCIGAPRPAAQPLRAALALALALAPLPTAALPAAVRGRQLIVEGAPFHMKGVNWNPVGHGDEHPGGVSFSGFVASDGALMADAGVNVIRTYESVNDTKVLDALWAKRIQVISTVYAKADTSLEFVAEQVRMVKDHPAILMWSVGNEWNYNGCYMGLGYWDCLARVREVVRLVKSLDSRHPVASVYGELPKAHELRELSDVDVWGINFYDELSFSDLFERWEALSSKPMFLGEYGADAYDGLAGREDPGAQAHATAVLSQEIVTHSSISGGVCLGGIIFEFADEWWKDAHGSPSEHNVGGIAPGGGPHPDRIFNEEWWGLVELDRTPRQAYWAYAGVEAPRPLKAGSLPGTRGHGRRSCTSEGCTQLDPPRPRGCALEAAPAVAASTASNATGGLRRRLGNLV